MIHIALHESVAAALNAQASARGLTVEEYLNQLLQASPPGSESRLSVDEFDRLLDAEASAGSSPSGSFSRASIYDDHD